MSVILSGLRADCKVKTVNPPTNSRPTQPPKLLDQVAGKMRLLHYSKRTQSAYVDWIKRFILFHNKHHPRDMGAAEIEGFLTHLAVERTVAASGEPKPTDSDLLLNLIPNLPHHKQNDPCPRLWHLMRMNERDIFDRRTIFKTRNMLCRIAVRADHEKCEQITKTRRRNCGVCTSFGDQQKRVRPINPASVRFTENRTLKTADSQRHRGLRFPNGTCRRKTTGLLEQMP